MIADGFHLPDLLKVVFRMKPGRSVLISDCTRFAGMEPGEYTIPHRREGPSPNERHPAHGQLLLGRFGPIPAPVCGRTSHCCLCRGLGQGLPGPLELLNCQTGPAFQPGNRADLVLLEPKDGTLRVIRTLSAGTEVYRS
ncbi:MAG: hypothetical protein R2751_10255 [Bacteroidales bacterium]